MGTSHAARQPKTMGWAKVVSSLSAPTRNPATILTATLSATVPFIPAAQVFYSATFAVLEGIRFVNDVHNRGFERAVRREALSLSDRFLIPSISDGLWNATTSKADPRLLSGPYGRIAEMAFKKTMTSIMTKGEHALMES